MKPSELHFDPIERAREKQASRDRDAARLESGEVSRLDLQHENSIGSHLPLSRYQIVAIGGRSVGRG